MRQLVHLCSNELSTNFVNMSYSTENLFESTRLSESGSARRPKSVNLDVTRTIKQNCHETSTESLNGSQSSQTIKVYLRVKPRVPKSRKAKKIQEEMYTISSSKSLTTKFPSPDGPSKSAEATKKFTFSKIFTPDSSQEEVFRDSTIEIIHDFLSGHNSTVMSYGTTDSGKTYTLYGSSAFPGIIPRTIEFIFSTINCTLSPWYKPLGSEIVALNETKRHNESEMRDKLLSKLIYTPENSDAWETLEESFKEDLKIGNGGAMYSVWLSFAEIYNENIYDLLTDTDEKMNTLKVVTDKQGRSFVPNLTMICATTGLEAFQIFLAGQSRLTTSSDSGEASSLSHSIFSITLLKFYSDSTADQVEMSTLTFCDLAGTGRGKLNSGTAGDTKKEAKSIKTGLLALGRCLQSVHDRQMGKMNSEIVGSFRESKLTRLFQRSLMGKEQLTIIACINPSPDIYVENQSVLHLCSIARKIFVTPGKELKKYFGSESTIPSPIKIPEVKFGQTSVETQVEIVDDLEFESVETQTTIETESQMKSTETQAEIRNEYEMKSVETQVDIDDKYDQLMRQNSNLLEEIEELKSNAIMRELKIREEMANFCSTMMKDMELNWQQHAKMIEEDQDDLRKWSVKQVETFYKTRIDSLTNRKRRRRDSDYLEETQSLEILEAENARITSRYLSVKESLKLKKRECDSLRIEKNTCVFELGLANEELREIRDFLVSQQKYFSSEYKDVLKHLKLVIFEKNQKIKSLEESLHETMKSQSREQIEAEDPGNESQNTSKELSSIYIGDSTHSISSDSSSEGTLGPDESASSIMSAVQSETHKIQLSPKLKPTIFETIDKTLDLIRMDKQGDSGIGMSTRLSSTTRDSMGTDTDEKSSQTSDFPQPDEQKLLMEDRIAQLKRDYKNLQSDHLQGSIRINELSKELEHIRRVMQNLKEVMYQSDQKIVEYQLKLAAQEVDLENVKDCNVDLENKLSQAQLDFEKTSLQCITEHLPKINRLQRDLSDKTEKITYLNQKITTIERDLQMVHNLQDRVSDFTQLLEKYKCEKDELSRELHERTLSQSSLECKLKLLSSRVHERENEITCLRTDLVGIVRMNTLNGERVNELSGNVANALTKLTTAKEEMRRSELERRELERASSQEISNLAARFKRSAAILNMIHEGNDDVRGELERAREILSKKEREMALFKKNRDSTIRRYELLVHKLQGDVERNNRELLRAKGKRTLSKESLESVERENTREVPGDSLIKARSSKRTFNIRNRNTRTKHHHHCRLTCSARRLSSRIVASLTSLSSSPSKNCKVMNVKGEFVPNKTQSSSRVKMFAVDRKDIAPTIPTPNTTSTSDDSGTDYKELSNWMKIKKTNGRTQFVIRQAEITVENAVKKSCSED